MIRRSLISNECLNDKVVFDILQTTLSVSSTRAWKVYELYGVQTGGGDSKPLFNENSWKKARQVLDEIKHGFASDPPDMNFYFHKIDKNGNIEVDKHGLYLYTCIRGTNDVENVHKQLRTTFGRWTCGIEMSVCLLMWFCHRYNIRSSIRHRTNYPQVGHYDTWLVDELQGLVARNHGVLLYPSWSNTNDFADTPERFGLIPIHDMKLGDKLKKHMEKKKNVKLSKDLQYIAKETGVPVPLLPFIFAEEKKLFTKLVDEKLRKKKRSIPRKWQWSGSRMSTSRRRSTRSCQ